MNVNEICFQFRESAIDHGARKDLNFESDKPNPAKVI